jgi:hypothetical protein
MGMVMASQVLSFDPPPLLLLLLTPIVMSTLTVRANNSMQVTAVMALLGSKNREIYHSSAQVIRTVYPN